MVPVIVVSPEKMVKLALNVSSGPVAIPTVPGMLTAVLCGPIVNDPVSAKAPGKGPVAAPVTEKLPEDVPSGLHWTFENSGVPEKRISLLRFGLACARAADGAIRLSNTTKARMGRRRRLRDFRGDDRPPIAGC